MLWRLIAWFLNMVKPKKPHKPHKPHKKDEAVTITIVPGKIELQPEFRGDQ